ncbi:hypothetical protein RR46_04299 [Papilio xuthus]|uniref:Ig-like domain-containing protein n=1 Tax=Papilio xuthus TaxID=66420 RepID=A0A194QDY6_PAPXU|nr:hypothetical protein RR46_04299 [Papilio xuthus]
MPFLEGGGDKFVRDLAHLYLFGGHPCANARSVPHTITLLEVPLWADPRREAELRCHYARQPRDPPLHSVKWYRDNNEIFRYTPQELESRAFNNSEVTISNSSCSLSACVVLVRPERGGARYTCEVSSEGPRFAVDKRSANMTLAVLPEYDPLITGLPTLVQVGETALVNCTSDYSLPAAEIDWFVDSEPQEDPLITGVTHVSGADGDGLRASWRTLHVFPEDYATPRGYLSLRCRATLPTRPPHVRSMAVRLNHFGRCGGGGHFCEVSQGDVCLDIIASARETSAFVTQMKFGAV